MREDSPMTRDAEAIRCEGLSKHFGKLIALDHLDLAIEKGACFGFLGPNGAGKTTTLRLLAGITHPTSGKVWVAGQDVTRNTLGLRSLIGYLPETPAYYDWMTGREFLRFTADLYGMQRASGKTRTEELLKQVNLTQDGHRRVGAYSRGMKQRLGLAQALLNRPEVLLLDEPASALDPMGRREMLEAIRALKGETTVFLSTHILANVERLCDRVAIIDKGRTVRMGTIDELRAQQGPSVFEVQFEEDGASAVARLENVPWVTSVKTAQKGDRPILQVEVNDLEKAKKELPRLLVDTGLTLLRYELTAASLEEVFIDLVGGGEAIE